MKQIKTALYWDWEGNQEELPDWREDRKRRLFPEGKPRRETTTMDIDIPNRYEELMEHLETRESELRPTI